MFRWVMGARSPKINSPTGSYQSNHSGGLKVVGLEYLASLCTVPLDLGRPLSHLLPSLHQFLNRSGLWNLFPLQTAAVVCGSIEVLQSGDAHLRKLAVQFR